MLVGTNLPNTRTQNPGRTIEVTGMMIDRAKARRAGVRRGWLPSAGPAAQKLAALTDQAEAEVEPRKRIALLQEFDRRLGHVGPFAPLFQPAVPYAYWSNVQEVACHSVWAIDFYPIRKTV